MAVIADGRRRMKVNRDVYDFWRIRCHGCGWSGCPWEKRSDAVAEFDRHDCDHDGYYADTAT